MKISRHSLFALAVLVVALVVAGCGGDDADTEDVTSATPTVEATATPAPTPEAEPPPTPAPEPGPTPTPTPTPEPTPVPPVLEPGAGALLVAADDGLFPWEGGTVTPVIEDRAVSKAVPDHRGGVVFELASEPVATIEWMPGLGQDPVGLSFHTDARWRGLEDVSLVRGVPVVLYREVIELPNDCEPGNEECRWAHREERLIAHDLESGRPIELGTIGSFESSVTSYSMADPWTAFEFTPYGSSASCVGLLPTALFDGVAPDDWIGDAVFAGDAVTWLLHGRCSDDTIEVCGDSFCAVYNAVAMAPDGSSLAVAWMRQMFGPEGPVVIDPLVVSIIDPATGEERSRLPIGGEPTEPTWLDYDGSSSVILGFDDGRQRPPVLVEPDGTVTELDIGWVDCANEWRCPTMALWTAQPSTS